MQTSSLLPSAALTNRRVFLRADLNVPLSGGKIVCDFRLKALKATLDLLVAKKSRIILATHLGRPHGFDEYFSTKILVPWLESHGYTVLWLGQDSFSNAYAKSQELAPGTILLLENMRFFAGEQSEDAKVREEFAKELRTLGDYYVNDAFALLHRNDTSITLLPELYEKKDKTIGLLIEREITMLSTYFNDPARPFMVIIGGGKVKDKLPFIERLLDKVDSLIVLPALVFTFLKAMGNNVGKSLVDEDFLEPARRILVKAQEKSVRVVFPLDYMVAMNTLSGPLEIVGESEIPANGIGIAVGPKTLELYKAEIMKMKTVFVNGAMGLTERTETLEPLYDLMRIIARSRSCSIIGGGESVAAIYACKLEEDITYCSTGGGASLYFLTYGTLPALKSM